MRRPQEYRSLILSGGVTLYAVGMWFAWFDEQQQFGRAASESVNHERASTIFVLAGVFLILFGTVVQGLRLSNARRALGGAGMILTAIVMVSLWDRGIDFLYLAPSIHGWSAGFLLLPLLLLASGIAWLLMAIGGALRAGRSSDAGLLEEPNMSMALERKSRANSLVIIVASVLGTLVVLSIVGAIIGRTTNTKADARLHVELNEADAIAALRVIAIAADTYRESYHHYPSSLKELGPSVSGGANEYAGDLIDRRLASGTKDGYMFSFAITMTSQGSEAGFAVHADPLSASTGGRHFYVNETGIIRWNTLVATSDSPAVE